MGLANSTTKVSVEEKLQFLETKVIKPCTYHRKDCLFYCAIPNCDKCPYLCQDCARENIHQHEDGIYNHEEFLKAIVTLIELKRAEGRQSLGISTSAATAPDYSALYKQHVKLIDHIDALQKEIRSILSEFRSKLQTSLDRLSKTMSQNQSSKSTSYINFYRNPNILACKLASEQSDKFLLQLKAQLRSSKRPLSNINEQEYFGQLKIQLGSAKSKIRDLLNVANLVNFGKKNTVSYSMMNATLKKTFMLPNQSPLKMFLAASTVNVGTSKQVFNVDCSSKEVRKMYGQPVSAMTSRSKGQEFIGILSQTKIIVYDCKSINQITLLSRVSSANILKYKRRLYGLIGEEEGILNVLDLEQNKSIFSYRCADQPLHFIQICESNSTICCAGRKTSIFMFRYKSKYSPNDDTSQIQFEYVLQMNSAIIPQGQLQLMRINSCELYLFGPCRNISVFDLMLNTQIIRTEYIKKCGVFLDAHFLTLGDSQYMVSLNQNEDVVNFWYIDKIKRNLRVDELLKEKNQRFIASIACPKGELWVIREGQKNIDVFSLSE